MFGNQLLHQCGQFRKPACGGEQNSFFGGKMDVDFLLEVLFDLRLPVLQIRGRDRLGAIDPHA